MTRLLKGFTAVGLWLGLAIGVSAQDSINAFGGYPTGMYMPSATSGMVYSPAVATYPTTYSYRPYGATSLVPGATYYSSGYSSVGPRATYYSSGYSSGVAPGATYYSSPAGSYTTYSSPAYGYTTYSYPTYSYRRGFFGRRAWGW